MTTQHRTTLPAAAGRDGPATRGAKATRGVTATRDMDSAEQLSPWAVTTTLTAWCRTCGTDVEFAAPVGAAPADLAAEERGCVWCGEALVVFLGRTVDPTETASVA